MFPLNPNHLKKVKEEGRICANCGWMIPKKRWKEGKRLCTQCEDALKGVNPKHKGHGPYKDE